MNKNFSERVKSLKNAVFGVKEIVEDSILSDFKDPNPQTVVDAESTEATKEIEKVKDSVEVVDKTEGTEELKNFTKKNIKLDPKLDDDYYKLINYYLKLARTKKNFENFRNLANDLGYRNRLLDDKKFLDEFLSGKNLEDEKDKNKIIGYRKALISAVKKAKELSDKTIENTAKELSGSSKKDMLKNKSSKSIGVGIKKYIQNKISKKESNNEILTKDEKKLYKESNEIKKVSNPSYRRDAFKKLATAGMDDTARSFVEGVVDLILGDPEDKVSKEDEEAAEKLGEAAKLASEELPSDLVIEDDELGVSKKSGKSSTKKSDSESAKPKEVSKSEEKKDEAKKVAFSSDPMEALFEGHLNKEYTEIKNFSVSKEFEDYEKVLNSISEI